MRGFFTRLTRRLATAKRASDELPIREELYSIERLEQYAATLAQEHKIAEKPLRVNLLLPRLEQNGRKLVAAYRALAETIRDDRTISPAAEWLADNFHIVEEQVREIREDLPKSYYYQLPKLAEGDFKDYPRIYAFATELIAHTDSHLDTETLRRFIDAYQKVAPLSIGELWAVPISLRLALVENLRRLATRIVSSRTEREEADKLADKLLEVARRRPGELVPLLSEKLGRRGKRIRRAFIVQLTQRLREQDPAVMPVFDWLERQLGRQDLSIDQIVHQEQYRQAAAQITVGNIITSMRLLSTLDWNEFFEKVSLIDPALAKDAAGVYSRQDFATRDRYRHVIERIAKHTHTDELEVARAAVELAEEAHKSGADEAERHVGYFLIGRGLEKLEARFEYRPRFLERFRRLVLRHPTFSYLGSLALLTALGLASILFYSFRSGAGVTALFVIALLTLVPASDLSIGIVNWLVMHTFQPRLLPRIETRKGIPEEACTMVVVPAILNNEAMVKELLEKLEISYLANQDDHIYFALLGDFVDAPAEEMADDGPVLDAALNGIEELNQRYRALKAAEEIGASDSPAASYGPPPNRFHLFHRRRQWNESEQKWLGWERKRGKLREFNRLLRGERDTSYIVSTAGHELLRRVRYVITLDADTQLPRDAARRLIGTAIHPLNQPRLDASEQRVTRGYGILQPRVSISLESASRTRFARIFSGNTGIDPYTTAASDVYQDLFGEGIYTGKGLYDVDAFETALSDRVPENSLLSHDLFESMFARAALVTDIEFLDDYPAYYHTYAKRQHRWTRGDWQIAGWLFPRVRDAHGNRRRNSLPLISRWKIVDNLRRSLLSPAMILLLVTGWTVLPGSPLWWTLFVALALAFPVYAHATTGLLVHPRGIPWTSHFWSVWGDLRTHTVQVALEIVFLAHQAQVMADAIVRTVYRKLISRRRLLEWKTSAETEDSSNRNWAAFFSFMWFAEVAAGAAALAVLSERPMWLPLAAPFLAAWAVSPYLAFLVSRRTTARKHALSAADLRAARVVARRTWRFFEIFVGDEDHWLPPDNFQEDPEPTVAHRTSGTNIGLLLLSTAAAWDFGYLGLNELVERLELTFATVEKLPRFRNHFFNWYDTRTLEPLLPRYISTVDSGNLAGHLIALKHACIEVPDAKLFDPRVLKGLADTIENLREETAQLGAMRQRTEVVTVKQLREEIDACAKLVSSDLPETLSGWRALLESLEHHATVIDDILAALSHEHGPEPFAEARSWTASLIHELGGLNRDFNWFVPWGAEATEHLTPIIQGCGATSSAHWDAITRALSAVPSLSRIPDVCDRALIQLAALRAQLEQSLPDGPSRFWASDRAGASHLTKAPSPLRSAGALQNSETDRESVSSESSITPLAGRLSGTISDRSSDPGEGFESARDAALGSGSVWGSGTGVPPVNHAQDARATIKVTRDAALSGLDVLTRLIEQAAETAKSFSSRLGKLAETCDRLFNEMDFRFLLDEERKVFRIGYNVTEAQPDNSFYDLLASEARLASFIAIAKGDVPQEHWFRLGRQLASADGGRALISWTGTMFEYLMPLLVMRYYRDTLLGQTYESVVARQIEYGYERGVPWGISESAFSVRDLNLNYQYGPFGVPGLGLKRGLIEDIVVSPYSTLLAMAVYPQEAIENLRQLELEGALSRYGFYEALDYTPERVPKNQKHALVRAFMTHHQGMSLAALDNALNGEIMQRRFQAEPIVQATELLLQERIPRGVPAMHPRAEEVLTGRTVRTLIGLVTRVYESADLPTPRTHLLSNGTYSVMITSAGSGYSMSGPLAVTRWREDVTRDHWGSFCYVRDVRSGSVWSAGYQPTGRKPQTYEVAFSEDKADFWRREAGIVTHTEIVVSAEDNAEMRRVSLANYSARSREIELTSYSELVLAPPSADLGHPAFSNLFVETEFHAQESSLLARRRPRSPDDEPAWGVHVIATTGGIIGGLQCETDRARFLGRGRAPDDPVAVMEDRPLSNTVGAVLDPIFSLRCRVVLKPSETAQVCFTTGVARSREEAISLAAKYRDAHIFDREARLAWTKAHVEMSRLNIDAGEAHLFQRLAGRVLYSDPSLRPTPHVLSLNTLGQSHLWPYGISGDLPIVVVRVGRQEDLGMVRQILRGHEYLHLKGLIFDLVILNDHPPTYAQALQDALQALVRTTGLLSLQDKPGGVFLRRADLMPEADRILLHAVARAVIVTERGSLEDQLARRPAEDQLPAPFVPRAPLRAYTEAPLALPELAFFNGLGGFSRRGREYVTVLGEGQWTPAPWSNIVANRAGFGFQVTESGGAGTWSMNSHENRLTPWSNDAVSDPPGEIIYIRDDESGTIWTSTPLPIRGPQPYLIRHGQGYTVFEHTSHGISQELLLFSPLDAPVKISRLRLRNRSDRRRRLSITSYNELVLGVNRQVSAPYIVTRIDKEAGAIFAQNSYNNEFANRVAFASTGESECTMTCDRKEFIGRNGSLRQPAALRRSRLSERSGPGLDPCTAIQTAIELLPGEAREVTFLLGEGESIEEARELNARFRQARTVNEAFEGVTGFWDNVLTAIEVKTPDASMDMIMNRWLLYQVLSCRVWGRSAFYQSSGAYGFRDQLQDIMALVYSRPELAREHILRVAARQFKEGDVQHWWHPPTGRGIRTRFSDDLLWLPYVTAFYVNVTGDMSVLDERVPFLDAAELEPDQVEAYMQPVVTGETKTVLEHCARAIDRSLATGKHGLPLMGSGDWNDGMNRVGPKGKGESVWLGWFLYTILESFAPLAERYRAKSRANRYRKRMENLKTALEQAWDGDWYRRAYFDDGTPLGSAQNDECRIDSIAQSWAVISGAAEPYRAARAMAAVKEYLIRRGDGLVVLLFPPFDKSALDPGYIKGYVPGVRENGGQYTHGALWTVIAFALLGDGDRAGELFALLNPINHASTRAGLHKYKVEPYVAAGDVYAVPPHTGRGGWTWYTGSAGWMYRAALEFILGFKLRGAELRVEPCIPRFWREYEITYRRGRTRYRIKVENPLGLSRGVASVELDGVVQGEDQIALVDDGQAHTVRVVMGEEPLVETPGRAEAEQSTIKQRG